jgi:hypothetical protein
VHTGARLDRALVRIEPVAYRKKLNRVVAFDVIRKTSRPRLLYDEGPLNSPEGQRFTPPRPDSHRGIYASTTLLTAGAEFAGSVAVVGLFQDVRNLATHLDSREGGLRLGPIRRHSVLLQPKRTERTQRFGLHGSARRIGIVCQDL